jgi:hypothetical protein
MQAPAGNVNGSSELKIADLPAAKRDPRFLGDYPSFRLCSVD